jgi:hypothetical protein
MHVWQVRLPAHTFRKSTVANENQQNNVPQQPGVPSQSGMADAALGARGASRRRFARAGAGATGVLLTLASHPGMACSVNVGPSGYQSAVTAANKGLKLSHAPTNYSAGMPPGRWARSGGWPCGTDVKFGSVFSCSNFNYSIANATLMQHCAGYSTYLGNKARIAQLLAAAHLNVLSGRSPFLTLQNLQAIWGEYQRTGQYTPMAGVTAWNAADIVTYLSGTMD